MTSTNAVARMSISTEVSVPVSVVHLVTNVNVGGLEHMVLQLARRTDRKLFETHVICLEGPGTLAPVFEAFGVPVETLMPNRLGLISRVAALTARLKVLNTKILHTHNPGPHLHGVMAAAFARIPILV